MLDLPKPATPGEMKDAPVYKLLTEADWLAAEAAGQTATALDAADGYVHLSSRAQLAGTAARYFAGQGRIRLLRFQVQTLKDLRWEPSRDGALFPHLYGPLKIESADVSCWLEPGADGAPVIPEAV